MPPIDGNMIAQYPHSLRYSTVTPASQDSNGDWVSGTTDTIVKPCRYEPANGSAFIFGADGQQVVYSGTVYMPLGISIAFGAEVEVWGFDNNKVLVLKVKGTVKRFDRGQLNQRIWL
jgi:hypothetical protein